MEDRMSFYFSKGKLFFSFAFLLLIIAGSTAVIGVAYTANSIFVMVIMLFLTVLFSFICVATVLKLFRNHPYIIITDEYIQLDPFTKSEATFDIKDIQSIKVSEVSFQKIIEITLYNEWHYFHDMSFHNKARLFMNQLSGFSLFTINIKVMRKQDRLPLLEALDKIVQNQNHAANIVHTTTEKQHEATDFMEKYDLTPPLNRSINRSYFLKSYGYGLVIFALLFIFFYLLISKNDNYLIYIIANLLVFPFGKALIDWLFGFKLRRKLDKQKGVTYYFDQLLFMFDILLFHMSVFIAPIGIVFLLIRFIIIRIKR